MLEPIIKPLFEGQEDMTPSAIVLECARRMYPEFTWLIVANTGESTDISSNILNNAEAMRFIDHVRESILMQGMELKNSPKK